MAEDEYGPVPETPGWAAMMAWLSAEKGRTVSGLARAVGVAQPSARAWWKRTARPDGLIREAVCSLTGSKPEDWETEAEKTARQERLAKIKKFSAEEESAREPSPETEPPRVDEPTRGIDRPRIITPPVAG
jgi:transposase-like protein